MRDGCGYQRAEKEQCVDAQGSFISAPGLFAGGESAEGTAILKISL